MPMMNKTTHRIAACVTLLWCLPLATLAYPPPGYYDSVDVTNSATLRATLHAVIDNHQRFPYTSGATDTWDILELADEDPNDADHILDVYKNASYLNGIEDTREALFPQPDLTEGPFPDQRDHIVAGDHVGLATKP